MSNDTQTLTLTGFLLARIAEDEDAARACTNKPWAWAGMSGRETVADMEHIARHSPGRVLAECAAKRQIVALAVDGFEHNPNSTLQILAAVYADHPDHQEEWRA